MDQIQDMLAQWWASGDESAHLAIIVFGSVLLVAMIFSIIGTYTNPSRRPRNEINFRKFAQARLAGESGIKSASNAEPTEREVADRGRLRN